ncbi:MAG: hypothetical protein K0Q79_3744 [Flavipsychrobacter sp.]|jgi:hypothetical protein|nr:hypothetical protein [Flavipsychrobacter sp.]
MNKIKYMLAIVLATAAFIATAQTPYFINYQAVARDAAGSILANQSVSLRLTVHTDAPTGAAEYQETQTVTTNGYGLFNLQIGKGTATVGNIAGIVWNSGQKYLQVEMDPTGGSSYIDMGTQQLASVPYSLHADKAATAMSLSGTLTMGGDVNGTNAAATVVALNGKSISTAAPLTGQALKWNGSAWTPTNDSTTTYAAGTALTLTGTTFSAQNTAALWNAGKLQGSNISTALPATGQALKWNGTDWAPGNDSNTTYGAGTGLTLTGTTFAAQNTTAMWNSDKLQGRNISTALPATGQALKWNGSSWAPATDSTNIYNAGTGMVLTGATFNAQNTSPLWNAGTLQGNSISAAVPTTGQALKWNGSIWAPANDSNTVFSAGTGLALTGTTFSAQNTTALWNASKIQGNTVSTTAPATGQTLKWNGSTWTPANDSSATFSAGTGLALSGTTFNAQNTSALWNANKLQGNNMSTASPATGQALKWNGSEWAPANDSAAAFGAGTGLTLTGTTFNAQNTTPMWNANTLWGNIVSSVLPVTGQVLKWSGSMWVPSIDNTASYTAGSGITISGTTLATQNSSAIWNANKLQGRSVSSASPATGQTLKWDGSSWAPSNDSTTAFGAGTGLTLTGTTFNAQNGMNMWNANQLQGRPISTAMPATGHTLKWNGSSWMPSNDSTTAFSAGTGLVLSGTTFHALNSMSMWNASLLQGRPVTAAPPSTGHILKWNGIRWESEMLSALTWSTTGNAGTNPAMNFIGTTDNVPFRLRANNVWAGEINPLNNNISYGISAGASVSSGRGNVAVGTGALRGNTTNSDLIAIGDSSLYTQTSSGVANMAVGSSALYANTTGGYNTAIGNQSLRANTSGSTNTAVGYMNLKSNTSGSCNTTIGHNCLLANTTGTFNTALGFATLSTNTTGNGSTAVGYRALMNSTTGLGNTANGYNSLLNNTTGYSNTATGGHSLTGNTSGNNNTALGWEALDNNTTGSNNTAVGTLANVSVSNLHNAMALGYNATVNASDKVVIGNTVIATIGGYDGWSNLSDGRFKTDIRENVPGVDFIMKLRPVTYKFEARKFERFVGIPDSIQRKNKESYELAEDKIRTGFIAQEVEQAANETGYNFDGVHKPTNENDNYSLVYAEFTVPLVKAVQEQQQVILQQQASIKKLEQQVAYLVEEMKRQKSDK